MTGEARVRYRERQPLSAADLSEDQAYHLAARRRHDTRPHTWGIVAGLALERRDDGVVLRAGFAIARDGTPLILTRDRVIVPDGEYLTGPIDLWLGADDVEGRARLRCVAAGSETVEPRARSDAVYLGRVEPGPCVPEAARPLAGLVGETVTAVSGQASLRVGGSAPGDRRVFTVSVPAEGAEDAVQRLTVDGPGGPRIPARATVHGRATVRGRVRPAWVALPTSAPPPEQAAPWQLYRADVPDPQDATRIVARQLRVEIAHPGKHDDPSRYRLVVGRRAQYGEFQPCLTVTADCQVTVHGKLTATAGPVTQGPVLPDPDDPRFAEAVLRRWLAGINAGSFLLDAATGGVRVEEGVLEVTITATEAPATEAPATGTAFAYTVTVSNRDLVRPVGEITVLELVTVNQISPVRNQVATRLSLAAGQQQTFSRSLTAQAGTLSVAVVALGVTPVGSVANAAATATWTIP